MNTNRILTRRGAVVALFTALLSVPQILKATVSFPKRQRVQWVRLEEESLRIGDFWASHDPNTPERQAEDYYNLHLQAVHPSCYGTPAKNVGIGNGAFWRPVGLVTC